MRRARLTRVFPADLFASGCIGFNQSSTGPIIGGSGILFLYSVHPTNATKDCALAQDFRVSPSGHWRVFTLRYVRHLFAPSLAEPTLVKEELARTETTRNWPICRPRRQPDQPGPGADRQTTITCCIVANPKATGSVQHPNADPRLPRMSRDMARRLSRYE